MSGAARAGAGLHTGAELLRVVGLGIVFVEDVGGNVGGVVGENHFDKRRCGKLE